MHKGARCLLGGICICFGYNTEFCHFVHCFGLWADARAIGINRVDESQESSTCQLSKREENTSVLSSNFLSFCFTVQSLARAHSAINWNLQCRITHCIIHLNSHSHTPNLNTHTRRQYLNRTLKCHSTNNTVLHQQHPPHTIRPKPTHLNPYVILEWHLQQFLVFTLELSATIKFAW
jgi:hypothetical protein